VPICMRPTSFVSNDHVASFYATRNQNVSRNMIFCCFFRPRQRTSLLVDVLEHHDDALERPENVIRLGSGLSRKRFNSPGVHLRVGCISKWYVPVRGAILLPSQAKLIGCTRTERATHMLPTDCCMRPNLAPSAMQLQEVSGSQVR
jgi:hypothetical protein